MTMIHICRLSECSFESAVVAWNRGFEDYFIKVEMTVEAFRSRMNTEGLIPSVSLVAFDGTEPVGVVLNGIRTLNGVKTSWNGGTAVAVSHRKQGIAKKLIQASMQIYKEEGVQLATLEAIANNEKAIPLYEQLGYTVTDRLVLLNSSGNWELRSTTSQNHYMFTKGSPEDASKLTFYNNNVAWQSGWSIIQDKGGESLMVSDQERTLGYALYTRRFDGSGNLSSITLFQCEVDPACENSTEISALLLDRIFHSTQGVRKLAFNMSTSNPSVAVMKASGFELSSEQVLMKKELSQ